MFYIKIIIYIIQFHRIFFSKITYIFIKKSELLLKNYNINAIISLMRSVFTLQV